MHVVSEATAYTNSPIDMRSNPEQAVVRTYIPFGVKNVYDLKVLARRAESREILIGLSGVGDQDQLDAQLVDHGGDVLVPPTFTASGLSKITVLKADRNLSCQLLLSLLVVKRWKSYPLGPNALATFRTTASAPPVVMEGQKHRTCRPPWEGFSP